VRVSAAALGVLAPGWAGAGACPPADAEPGVLVAELAAAGGVAATGTGLPRRPRKIATAMITDPPRMARGVGPIVRLMTLYLLAQTASYCARRIAVAFELPVVEL
jgi:hypothetical protein